MKIQGTDERKPNQKAIRKMILGVAMALCLLATACGLGDPVDIETATDPVESGLDTTEESTTAFPIRESVETTEATAEEKRQMSSEAIHTLYRNINTSSLRQVGPEGNMAVTNLGMYYTDRIFVGGNHAFKLMCFDAATGESAAVCSNASCLHEDRYCEAIYMPGPGKDTGKGIQIINEIIASPLGVYEDKLYVMVSEKIDSIIRLYVSDLNGHNRQLLWEVSYSGENTEHRLIVVNSAILNGSKVYVSYSSQDYIEKYWKEWDAKTQENIDVYTDFVSNLESGILCIDLSNAEGPIRVCEEGSEFFFEEKDTGGFDMYALNRGYVVMMAAKGGVVYYRHLYTNEVPDWEEYKADMSTYEANWNDTIMTKLMRADVQQGQVNAQEMLALEEEIRSEYHNDKMYYEWEDQVWTYDLSTNQSEVVVALEGTEMEGAALECVAGNYLVLRNYTEQKMYFVELDTMDVVVKEATLGNNLYGQVTFKDEAYWFFCAGEWGSEGERESIWFLATPQEYLTQEEYPRILVHRRVTK